MNLSCLKVSHYSVFRDGCAAELSDSTDSSSTQLPNKVPMCDCPPSTATYTLMKKGRKALLIID